MYSMDIEDGDDKNVWKHLLCSEPAEAKLNPDFTLGI
jgi:hypothetical protein